MQAAKTVRKAPRQVAEIIIKNMDLSNTYIDRVEAAGPGFINFFLTNAWLYDVLKVIQKKKKLRKSGYRTWPESHG